ncbi:hypothetical protein [Paenibacillus xylaniclasticus]|nr:MULTISPECIES: hypothetical protein [Paenibacillus]GFN31697.1 hypothetical protein PCURB6_19570 [Paenibacillus curdlanolyticus]
MVAMASFMSHFVPYSTRMGWKTSWNKRSRQVTGTDEQRSIVLAVGSGKH